MHFNNHSGKTWDASRGNVASPVDPAGNMAQDKAIPDRIHLWIQEGLTAAKESHGLALALDTICICKSGLPGEGITNCCSHQLIF